MNAIVTSRGIAKYSDNSHYCCVFSFHNRQFDYLNFQITRNKTFNLKLFHLHICELVIMSRRNQNASQSSQSQNRRSSRSSQNQSSQSNGSEDSIAENYDENVTTTVKFILNHSANKHPIKRSDIVKECTNGDAKMFQQILSVVQNHLKSVSTERLKCVD